MHQSEWYFVTQPNLRLLLDEAHAFSNRFGGVWYEPDIDVNGARYELVDSSYAMRKEFFATSDMGYDLGHRFLLKQPIFVLQGMRTNDSHLPVIVARKVVVHID